MSGFTGGVVHPGGGAGMSPLDPPGVGVGVAAGAGVGAGMTVPGVGLGLADGVGDADGAGSPLWAASSCFRFQASPYWVCHFFSSSLAVLQVRTSRS